MDLKSELQKIFKGEIENNDEVLSKYSHDASIFTVRPQVVCFPKDSEDVQNLVKWVSENKEKYPDLSITPRCAGTDMSGGAIGESIILDFTKYMNKLINFSASPSTFTQVLGSPSSQPDHSQKHIGEALITVQPGMFYRDFEKITLEKGFILPCYTASKSLNAMGGMYGNNSAGERTLQYGKTEDYVIEAKIVFADGVERIIKSVPISEISTQDEYSKKVYEILKNNEEEIKKAKPNVHKNSAGYYLWNLVKENNFDLNKLLVGSQGTLGIVTEITFRLVKPKPYTNLVVIFLRDISILPDLVNKILKYDPQTIETYDDKTFLLVLKYIYSFIKLLGFKNFFKLVLSFGPETKMTLRHGFPRLIMLVEFTGDTIEETNKNTNNILTELKNIKKIGVHLAKNEFEAKKYWTIRHEAFNLIRYHLKKQKSEAFIDDVIVRPEYLPEFLPSLYKILGEYKNKMTFAVGGHAGDGNMHIYTLLDTKDSMTKSIVMDVSEKVYDLVSSLGGSITAEHNDGIIRTPFLNKMYNSKILELFKQTKEIFDPKYIFNPGKKVPLLKGQIGTKEYVEKHITQ
ncbi:FAD-binding oxidoreductase [Candidatus Nomurabacteria bacterium]|nr:FAD-binding oxidoreductase [Candidatus Nomurabacteria bacterium]